MVHPDLMSGCPQQAVDCNLRSLQELNAYIDRLESTEANRTPFVARSIQFFKPMVSSSGNPVYSSLRPCLISLPSISPSADMLEKEDLSVQLIRQIETSMQPEQMFSRKSVIESEVEPIIRRTTDSRTVRAELGKIWDAEALDDQIKRSVYEAVDDRMSQYRNYQSIQIYNKLVKKYEKIKNAKRRLKRMSGLEKEVEEVLKERKVESSIDLVDLKEPDFDTKVRIIESGFHPDLVFFDVSLTLEERETGIARICGVNLEKESDTWLLENIWRAVRKERQPSVPIVLWKEFRANMEGGFLEIPFDFELENLVEFLEENLEPTRDARRRLLEQFTAI